MPTIDVKEIVCTAIGNIKLPFLGFVCNVWKEWEKQPVRVFLIKGVLKICSKFTGQHPCRSVINNGSQDYRKKNVRSHVSVTLLMFWTVLNFIFKNLRLIRIAFTNQPFNNLCISVYGNVDEFIIISGFIWKWKPSSATSIIDR